MMKYDPVGMFAIRLSTSVSCFATFVGLLWGAEKEGRGGLYMRW